jgi:hypothetical protein
MPETATEHEARPETTPNATLNGGGAGPAGSAGYIHISEPLGEELERLLGCLG